MMRTSEPPHSFYISASAPSRDPLSTNPITHAHHHTPSTTPISRTHAWAILHAIYQSNGFTGTLGTHAMRKTFANRVYDHLHHDLVRTQRALGHKNINSTVSYLSFRDEDIDAAILAG